MNTDRSLRPSRKIKKRFVRVLGAVLLAATLSACASANKTHTPAEEATTMMTPDEARRQILDLYEQTRAAIGGAWKVGGQDWSDCSTATGKSGATFNLHVQRLDQALPESAERLTLAIQKIWREQDIEASIWVDRSVKPAMHYLSFPDFGAGTAPDGYLVQFAATDRGYTDFDGTSHCVEGDSYELNFAELDPTPEGTAP